MMKLSIWRQFNSNHSSDYTIVGVFPTEAQAVDVGMTLKSLVMEIRAWRECNSHLSHIISPVEEQAAEIYGIEWEEPIDWLTYDENLREPYTRKPEQHIVIFKNLVLVDCYSGITWETGHQFAKIMKAKSADVFHDIFASYMPHSNLIRSANIAFNITAKCPDIGVANKLGASLKHHVGNRNVPMPWAIYHNRADEISHKLTVDNYAEQEAMFLDLNMEYEVTTQEKDIAAHISLFRENVMIQKADVRQDGIMLHLSNAKPIDSIYAIIAWLEACGCEVTYELIQTVDDIYTR